MHWLLSSTLFHLYRFVFLIDFFLLWLISDFMVLWLERMLDDFSFLKFTKAVCHPAWGSVLENAPCKAVCHPAWGSVLENAPCPLDKNVYSAAFGGCSVSVN